MSCNRENVTWQSKDGTWNRAFWSYYSVNEDDEDWDYEWDVEYEDYFNWVSTGHATQESAYQSWDGANPGGSHIYTYDKDPTHCDKLDALAADCVRRDEEYERYNPFKTNWYTHQVA